MKSAQTLFHAVRLLMTEDLLVEQKAMCHVLEDFDWIHRKAGGGYVKRMKLFTLWEAIKKQDYRQLQALFKQINGFEKFLKRATPGVKNRWHLYKQMAEISGMLVCFDKDRGIEFTDWDGELDEFVDLAIESFEFLHNHTLDHWCPVGWWLEYMASRHRIHPLVARDCLQKAFEAGKIFRYTQGSTPDTRYDDRKFLAFTVDKDRVGEVDTVHIYRGDFILPGKASVAIKLVRS